MLIDLTKIKLLKKEITSIEKFIKKNFTENQHRYYGGNFESTVNTFCDIYKLRYKLEYTTLEMANYFEITCRAMRNRLKLMGWEYDREEAQQLTVKKGIRDYSKIQLSKKKRLLQMLKGSNIESYIRHKINLDLTEILPECEIIVGINNISILGSREVDIPIIIIDKESTYKFAIEVNGDYWHEDKDTEDFKKEKDLNKIKYNMYQIIQFSSTKLQTEYGEIDEQVFKIIKDIKDKITQKTA